MISVIYLTQPETINYELGSLPDKPHLLRINRERL